MCSHSRFLLCQGLVGLHKCVNEKSWLYRASAFENNLTYGEKTFNADFVTYKNIVTSAYLCLASGFRVDLSGSCR